MTMTAPTEKLPLFWEPMQRRAKEEHRLPPIPEIAPAVTTLAARFEQFHEKNPHIYRALEDKTRQLLSEGRTRIGIAALVEEIRYDHRIGTRGEHFKINNNHRAFYSRMLLERIPELRDKIKTKPQTHALKKARAVG